MSNDVTQVESRRRALSKVAVLVAVAFLGVGCFEYEQVVSVRADGSGSIRETTVIKGPMAAMMRSMEMQEESGDGSLEVTTGMDDEQKAKDRAAALGVGVRFVSFEKISEGDREGGVAVYEFDDVTTLDLGAAPDMDESGMGMDEMGEEAAEEGQEVAAEEETKEGIGFRFERDGRKRVLVAAFDFEEKQGEQQIAGDVPADEGEADPMQEAAAGMMEAMKPMLAGMRMRTVVEVEGQVLEADAPIEEGSRVVLLDLDFDAILGDEEASKKLDELDDDASMGDFREVMDGFPGVVFPQKDEIRIVFE